MDNVNIEDVVTPETDYQFVERPMTKEDKVKWLEALRSGEYEQDTLKLKTTHGFCCLGVACEVLDINSEASDSIRLKNDAMFLDKSTQMCLAQMNDGNHTKARSFKEIADYIEKNVPAVDEMEPNYSVKE